jgi:HAE1 family hydrophobic/amphiphilic exporter-1
VFVPVGFIPGIVGQLYQQFAVVVSVSMLLSAINALTLSPALCGILLRPVHKRPAPIRVVLRGIDAVRDGYAYLVAKIVRFSILGLIVVALALAATAGLSRLTPTGFLPEEDQGAFMGEIQLPEGASVNRTLAVTEQVEAILRDTEGVVDVLTVPGYSQLNGLAQSNAGFIVVRLGPFEERADPSLSATSLIAKLRGEMAAIRGANVILFNLPPIIGLGTAGGFEYQLQDFEGRAPEEIAAAMRGLVFAANQDPKLAAVFSIWAANNPQLYLEIDRDKAQTLGVKVSDIFNALQATLGG